MMAAAAKRASADGGGLITRKIPSSGEELPVLGLGTSGPFEVGESPGQRAPPAPGHRVELTT